MEVVEPNINDKILPSPTGEEVEGIGPMIPNPLPLEGESRPTGPPSPSGEEIPEAAGPIIIPSPLGEVDSLENHIFYNEETDNDEGTSETKEITRDLARAFIGNPVNAFVTQHPYLTEFLTGVPVADIFHIAGFDMVDGVWHSRPDAWQQIGGYNDIYDVIFDYATSMDKDKFEFSSEGRDYIFWAWKGDYLNLGAGAELGIYSNESGLAGQFDVTSPTDKHWLVDTSLAMPMTMTLNYNGEEIASYEKEHWWITSFNPYYQDVDESELSVIYTIDFTGNETLYNDFIITDDYMDNRDKWNPLEGSEYKLIYEFK